MNKVTLIGLGNPGKKYAATRHNAGKMFVQYLKQNPIENLEAVETNYFMNESGKFVARFARHKLLIAHDDLDLSLGQFKIQFGHGPHDHKGLLSIYQALGTKNFWHVRIGIDNRQLKVKSENLKIVRETGETYTLKPFKREEREILEKVFAKIKLKITEKNTGFNL